MNQCQGCHAGWPVKEHHPWPKGSQPIKFHEVKGGYKGELVVCTAYQHDKESKK